MKSFTVPLADFRQVKTTSNGVSGFFADAWVVMGKRAADGWSEAVLARWAS